MLHLANNNNEYKKERKTGRVPISIGKNFIFFFSFSSIFSFCLLREIVGIFVGFGATMVRESSAVMLGHYFKRRRQFVEMITMSGGGVGIALFSVILKEGVG